MDTLNLKGQLRTEFGKKANKALRMEEKVPCILYGGKENVNFSLSEKDLKRLVYTPNAYIVNLEVEGKAYTAIRQDLQFHPVSDGILHVDFLEISKDKPVDMNIPVELTGFAVGVRAGGKLSLDSRYLKVRGLYKDFPNRLLVDITNLELGKTIQVVDLSFDNLELLTAPNAVVAAVKLTRAARGQAAAAAGTTEGEA